MIKQKSKIPKKSPNSSIFLSDEDDDIDQFRQLEEAVQQDTSDDSDLFLNPDRLKKKFPNLFNDANDANQKISSSSSFDDNDKIYNQNKKIKNDNLFKENKKPYHESIIHDDKNSCPDNTEQILQLTNDLHQAFKLVTQKKAELEREQQKFIKEKKMFAKEKAKYESEQIFADTEAGSSTSYMLLNQKYNALKDKYKFKKSEWEKERQQYINQIKELNEKVNELHSKKDFSPNRTNSIAHIDVSSDSELPNELEKTTNNQFNNIQKDENKSNNDAKDNPFNLVNVSPTMNSKYSQNRTSFSNNSQNKKEFKKLFSDGSDNDSDNEQFDIIEDNNINYNSNNAYAPAKSNIYQVESNPLQTKIQQNIQISPNSRQISPQIPASLKPSSNESNISNISIEPQIPPKVEPKVNKIPEVRNWDDYDDSGDEMLDNDDDAPKIDKPLVFRAVIPKDTQKANNNSGFSSSPPLQKKNKDSSDSSFPKNIKKNEISNNKVQKKTSPIKKNSKIAQPTKKASPNNSSNNDESSPNLPDSSQKPFVSYPPLFNMNINSKEPSVVSQKTQQSTANIISPSLGSNIKKNNRSPNFSLFENYDVNFDTDFGEIIDEKDGQNHRKIIKYFDGSTEIVFPNGTRKVTRSNCVYVFYQNGDISQDFNDGARAYKYSNGTIDLTLPNGVILCVFPNGQREKHFLNGDKEIVYPSGEVKYLKASNTDA